jgi:Cu+-exporting ATPase
MSVCAFDIFSDCPLTRDDLVNMVGMIESNSEHPIGKSIADFAPAPYKHNLESTRSVPGSGMQATISHSITGKKYTFTIGNLKFTSANGCQSIVNLAAIEKHHQEQGRTVIFVAIGSMIVALIALADTIKPEAPAVIRCLRKMGIKVAMVTGDQELTAHAIAELCGIREVHAGITPDGKRDIIATMQLSDCVGMVGDGVNDSASLAQSDMGIAVYGGTDVAISAASIVLMRPDLKDVVTAIDLSRTILRRIWINFAFASVYNLSMIPLAMGVGAPWGNFLLMVGLTLPAMVSAMAMSVSSVSVVLSSLHLQWYRKPVVHSDGTTSKFSSPFTDLAVDASESSLDIAINNATSNPSRASTFFQKMQQIFTKKQSYNRLYDGSHDV